MKARSWPKGRGDYSGKSASDTNLGINVVYIYTPDEKEYKVIGNNTVDLAAMLIATPENWAFWNMFITQFASFVENI